MNHNRIRAAVMGGLDGVITLLLVVVGGFQIREAILVLLAGALSMSIAEFASVSAQRDTEVAANPLHSVQEIEKEFNPWDAGISSFLSFAAGGGLMILPLIPSGHHWDSFGWIMGGLLLFLGGVYSSPDQYPFQAFKNGLRLLLLGAVAAGLTYLAGVLL